MIALSILLGFENTIIMAASPRGEQVPRREEWALINNHKMMEFERMQQL